MRETQVLSSRCFRELARVRKAEQVLQVLMKHTSRVVPLMLADVCWNVGDRDSFPLYTWERNGSVNKWERQREESCLQQLQRLGEGYVLDDLHRQEELQSKEEMKGLNCGCRQMCVLPLEDERGINGYWVLYLESEIDYNYWEMLLSQVSELLASYIGMVEIIRKSSEVSRRAWKVVKAYNGAKTQLEAPLVYTSSDAMKRCWNMAYTKSLNSSLLILEGEQGTGRETLARRLNYRLGYNRHSFTVIDLSYVREEERADLFSNTAATGAWEENAGGTVFIRHAELASAELLQRIEEKVLKEEGRGRARLVVFATSKGGSFRQLLQQQTLLSQELVNRSVEVPSFRERKEDILAICNAMLEKISAKLGVPNPVLKGNFIPEIMSESWEGNASQMKKMIEQALLQNGGRKSLATLFPGKEGGGSRAGRPPASLDDQVKKNIIKALRKCKGKVYGDDGAAAILQLNPSTLQGKMRKFSINPADFRKK